MSDHIRADRIVEVASVVLISVAAVLTAVCGYQSGRWDGQQARLYNLASADRTRAAEDLDQANVLRAIDVGIFLHYIDAVQTGNRQMVEFLRRRLRPEMRTAMNAWLATRPLENRHAPSSPFVMRQYVLASRGRANGFDNRARADYDGAIEANHHADDFLLLTVTFAGVSFLAGISTKMLYPRHAVVVGFALVATIYGIVRLIALPFL